MSMKILIGLVFAVAFLFSSATLTHAALTINQVNAIISLLQAFGADQSVVDNVRVSLTGGTPTITTTTTTSAPSCTRVDLKYNLYLGVKDNETGGDVTKLQKFLAQDTSVYPAGLVTGFFGPMTERAVQKWQVKNGVVSSGAPDTTGYGVVGPKTRERITGVCGGGGGTSAPSITVLSPNGGEMWKKSSVQTIKWLSSQNFPDESFILITLRCDEDLFMEGTNDDGCRGTSITSRLGTVLHPRLSLNQTQFSWTVPQDIGEQTSNYLINIKVILGETAIANDISNMPFSIIE